jgi:hypothetical protein
VPNSLVRIEETSLNLKFNPYNISWMVKHAKISFKLLNYIVTYYLGIVEHCSSYCDARSVTTLPPSKNLVPRFGSSSCSNEHSEHLHHSSVWQDKVWMSRTEEVFAFPGCFFFRVVAPLYLEEHGCFSPRDTILLIQDHDRVLGVRQVSLERCHFRQYDVHRCLQTPLQLRHVEDVMNSN